MPRSYRLLTGLLVLAIVGGGLFAGRLWRQQHVRALALGGVPAQPDLRRWTQEFIERVDNASQNVTLSRDPRPPLGELARLYLINGFTPEATLALRALHQLEPRNPRWAYYLADARLKARDQTEARELLLATIALAPDYAPAHRQLAELFALAGDPAGAARHRTLEEKYHAQLTSPDPWIAELTPDCYDAYRLQLIAEASFTFGRPADAVPALQRAMKISPDEPAFPDMLASAHEAAGRFDDARAVLEKSIEAAPAAFSLRIRLASLLCRLQRAGEAVTLLQRALLKWPEQAELHAALGHALLIAGRPAEAAAAFQAALARNDRLTEAHYNLGNCLVKLGRRDEAKASYARAVALRPAYAEALTVLGELALDSDDAETADRCGTALLALKPNQPEARRIFAGGKLLKAHAAVGAGQLAEATALFQRGIEVDPALGILHAGLGMIYVQTGRLREAIPVFETYRRVSPEDVDAYLLLGRALGQADRLKEAHQTLTQGLALAHRQGDQAHAAEFEQLLKNF